MKFAVVIVALLFLGTLHAAQTLPPGEILYNNITVSNGQSIVIGVTTNAQIKLYVIQSSDLQEFLDSQAVSYNYDSPVSSGIYTINVNAGQYTVIVESQKQGTSVIMDALASKTEPSEYVDLNGQHSFQLQLSNYSQVNFTILSSSDFAQDPVTVNITNSTGFEVSADSNLEYSTIDLGRGTYTVNLNAPSPESLFVLTTSSGTVINPLDQVSKKKAYATGVVSYGLYNISGHLIPYQVSTNEVAGSADISSLGVLNSNPPVNTSVYGASLQLNVEMNTQIDGNQQVFWLQNVADFNTSSGKFEFVDNIWNNSLPMANVYNASLSGQGRVTSCTNCNTQKFYAYTYPQSGPLTYSMPLNMTMITLINQTGQGTVVSFGYQIYKNGVVGGGPVVFYDHVLIHGASGSSIVITPFYTTPQKNTTSGNDYNAEFVFGGESNGADAHFNNMAAALWIYYLNGSVLNPFPSVYTFALNTEESASGIAVVPSQEGALVQLGRPDIAQDIIISNTSSLLAGYISNATSLTTSVLSLPGGSVAQTIPSSYLIMGGAAIVIIILLALLLRRRTA